MSIVVADVSERKMQMVLSESVDQMAKMLSMTREPAQDARKAMQTMREDLLPGSAQWLLIHDDYKDWNAAKADSIPLLLLSGDTKTGKSFLLAAAEEELRRTNTNVAIAYHEFTGRDLKNSRDTHKEDVVAALKSMALQLASQNKPYAKEMAALKDEFKPPEINKDKEVWEKLWWDKLRFSKHFHTKEDVNVCLIFDELEAMSDSNRGKLIKLLKTVRDEACVPSKFVRQHMRIIATGTVFENNPLTPIEISQLNEHDIELYIEEELKKDEVLEGQHVEMVDLLKAIRATLPVVARGSFSIAQQKLERIREAVDSDAYLNDVETILHESPTEDWGKLAGKVISDLNASLNAHDIGQLNELLHWCIFGYQYFTVDELRAALFLSSGKAALQPFERKLKNKYMRILHLDDDRVQVDPDIDNLFRSREISTSTATFEPDLDHARISLTVLIDQADLRTVQRSSGILQKELALGGSISSINRM